MTRARLILNGAHGDDEAVRESVRILRQRGHEIEVRVTWEAGDASDFAASGCRKGVERLIAGGGDGTLNEVVNGILSCDLECPPILGILPLGTGNDFATGCGVPSDSRAAMELAVEGVAAAVDVGVANDRYFINVASGGMGARITAETPSALKQLLGGGAYLVNGLLSFSQQNPSRLLIRGPGWQTEETLVIGAVSNGRQAGGGFVVAPEARIDDGLLDVLVVGEFPLVEAENVLDEIQQPTNPHNCFVRYWQTPWVEVEMLEGGAGFINVDGEQMSVHKVRFEVLPQRLLLVLPEGSPLLSQVEVADKEENRA